MSQSFFRCDWFFVIQDQKFWKQIKCLRIFESSSGKGDHFFKSLTSVAKELINIGYDNETQYFLALETNFYSLIPSEIGKSDAHCRRHQKHEALRKAISIKCN
jgi:hypothetical protein